MRAQPRLQKVMPAAALAPQPQVRLDLGEAGEEWGVCTRYLELHLGWSNTPLLLVVTSCYCACKPAHYRCYHLRDHLEQGLE